ncbi:DUF3179 domain-containing (seleno)protein [Photobacterium sp. OFAV2-7]|uniref:DUF3179 domain-containing (seleno)protein n=1 Tax=Photobacterium sp. OFAV2-7 TaxID=2917748 RepID=UPI001EF49F1C|nr:DUF3179 domain-containing (seleno)protein [Photobacterium sp. OFAV2-7]MCG7585464.1 DUF3179 domain-containing protein [Photobacterium sp. OFAV2-7]
MKDIIKQHSKIIFWVSMLIAQVIGAYLFKDLADISQWVVQSPRETTIWVWNNRWMLTLVGFATIAITSFLKYKQRDIVGNKTYISLTVLFAFTFFCGMINPHIMMRARMDNGVFVSIEEAKKYVKPYESVIVLEINGKARAHSDKQLLRPHVAGNGELGGENVVMTYCGLTNLGMAVTPEINGQPLDLAPMTQLENNLVMYDKISGEPIQQLWAQSESDRNNGSEAKMREWPTFRMPFEKFAMAYPDGEVYVNDYLVEGMRPSFWENPFLAIYDPIMELIFKLAIGHQKTNDEPTFPTIEHIDPRLPSKLLVHGLNIDDDYVAYTEEFVREQSSPINATIGGKEVVISYDEEFKSLGVFYNTTGKTVTEVDFYGQTPNGKLPRVESVKAGAFWLIWANFFPETDINRV